MWVKPWCSYEERWYKVVLVRTRLWEHLALWGFLLGQSCRIRSFGRGGEMSLARSDGVWALSPWRWSFTSESCNRIFLFVFLVPPDEIQERESPRSLLISYLAVWKLELLSQWDLYLLHHRSSSSPSRFPTLSRLQAAKPRGERDDNSFGMEAGGKM